MLEPFIWMFKNPDFKKHFVFLFLKGLLYFGILLFISFIALFINKDSCKYFSLILHIIQIILILIPLLGLTGYFWSLTDCIINRDDDVIASNIYNGRIKTIKKISLPKLNFFKFVWRGIASVYATFLFCLPCFLIYTKIISNMSQISQFWQIDAHTTSLFILFLIIFISVFIPALMWNYARRDSVIAVLNIPKAVYIMGNYTGKYFLNTFLFLLLSVIYAIILNAVVTATGAYVTLSISANGAFKYSVAGNHIIISFIIFYIVNYVISIYWLYVNAYLLGTITPTNEA